MLGCLIFAALLIFTFALSPYTPDPTSWRSIDGKNHNPFFPYWGATGIDLVRRGPAAYADGISSPRTTETGNPLPSPRYVSNTVFQDPGVSPKLNRRGLTDFVTYWGQFLDHDVTYTSGDPNGYVIPLRMLPIEVPKGDPIYDPDNTGNVTLPFFRGIMDNTTGVSPFYPWTPLNLATSWIDGSQIYGSDMNTAIYLRTYFGGLLKYNFINNEEYPIFNDGGITMQSAGIVNQSSLFIFGDVRGNGNPGLTALQILFFREHNRRARKLAVENPSWTDEELYQESRKMVIAIINHITEEEYIPVTLGEHFEEYTFNSNLSPNIYVDFSAGAFRYGHSEVNSYFLRLNNNSQPIPQGPLQLKKTYYNPTDSILSEGLDPILRGMCQQLQGAVDIQFVDDLRNYLFETSSSIGMDLVAINIQRGRDQGLPGINTFRYNYNLPLYTSWSEINPDPVIWQALQITYEKIDDCDVYVCGLAEVPYSLANVGETFYTVIKDQFHRMRDSDPAWYEADGYLSDEQLNEVQNLTLSDIIIMNTNIKPTEIPCFSMALPDGCGKYVPPPQPSSDYDFLVTLIPTTKQNPLYGNKNRFSFAINGVDGAVINLQRGRNYTFYIQISCNHAFYIATTPDKVIPPYAPAYSNVVHQYACLHQNPLVTLIVDDSTPSTLYYQCSLHNYMGGVINILSDNTSIVYNFLSSVIGLSVFVGILGAFFIAVVVVVVLYKCKALPSKTYEK